MLRDMDKGLVRLANIWVVSAGVCTRACTTFTSETLLGLTETSDNLSAMLHKSVEPLNISSAAVG